MNVGDILVVVNPFYCASEIDSTLRITKSTLERVYKTHRDDIMVITNIDRDIPEYPLITLLWMSRTVVKRVNEIEVDHGIDCHILKI